MNGIEEKVCEVFSKFTGLDKKLISKETNIRDSGIDSLAFVAMIASIEKEFNIQIDDDNLDYSIYEKLEDIIKILDINSK